MNEDDGRSAGRRGSEHVRIKGTTEELGEIIPPPVSTDDGHVEVWRDRDPDERDDER